MQVAHKSWVVRILAKVICTTLRPEFRVPTDLFLLFAHGHLAKIYGPLSFILFFVHDHSSKTRVLTDNTTDAQEKILIVN